MPRYVIVGGGIAAISCLDELVHQLLLRAKEQRLKLQVDERKSESVAELLQTADKHHITVLSASPLLKHVTSTTRVTDHLSDYEVGEQSAEQLEQRYATLTEQQSDCSIDVGIQIAEVLSVDTSSHTVATSSAVHEYDRLCLASGARPTLVTDALEDTVSVDINAVAPYVLGLRDTNSVHRLISALQSHDIHDLTIVGNGGIALELIHSLLDHILPVDSTLKRIRWLIRDSCVGKTFFDDDASAFLLHMLQQHYLTSKIDVKTNSEQHDCARVNTEPSASMPAHGSMHSSSDSPAHVDTHQPASDAATPQQRGSALGPNWLYELSGKEKSYGHVELYDERQQPLPTKHDTQTKQTHQHQPMLTIATNVDVRHIARLSDNAANNLSVELDSGETVETDLILSATGVEPTVAYLLSPDANAAKIELDSSNGNAIVVDEHMRTTAPNVYAAGDCCHCNFALQSPDHRHWLQMRLWSQAHPQGVQAARSMVNDTYGPSDSKASLYEIPPFELFTHVSTFFGLKVVLLGCFKRQGLDAEQVTTYTKADHHSQTFIKVILVDGRMRGCTLIGQTELEETFEHLILNGIDLEPYGDFVNSGVDLEDYFD